jgi:hypothetical protein
MLLIFYHFHPQIQDCHHHPWTRRPLKNLNYQRGLDSDALWLGLDWTFYFATLLLGTESKYGIVVATGAIPQILNIQGLNQVPYWTYGDGWWCNQHHCFVSSFLSSASELPVPHLPLPTKYLQPTLFFFFALSLFNQSKLLLRFCPLIIPY